MLLPRGQVVRDLQRTVAPVIDILENGSNDAPRALTLQRHPLSRVNFVMTWHAERQPVIHVEPKIWESRKPPNMVGM